MDPVINPFGSKRGVNVSGGLPYTEQGFKMTSGAMSVSRDLDRAAMREPKDPLAEQTKELTHRKTQIGYAKQATEQLRDKFLETEGADLFEKDPTTGKHLKNPDDSYVPRMGSEIDGLRTKSQETVGFLKGALTTAVKGDPTDEARRAQTELATREPIYKAKMDKWQRIQDQMNRIKAAGDETEMQLGQIATTQLEKNGVLGTPATEEPPPAAGSGPSPTPNQPTAAPAVENPLPGTQAQPAGVQPGLEQPAGPTPLALVKMHKQMKDAEAVMAMDTSSPKLKEALRQKNERTQEMFLKGMALLPSDGLRQRVIDITRDPTTGELVKNFMGRLGEGAGSALVDMGEFALRNTSKAINALTPAGSYQDIVATQAQKGVAETSQAMRDEASSWGLKAVPKEVAEKLSESFSGMIGQGLGSTAAFMVPTMGALRIGEMAGATPQVLKAIALAVPGLAGGMQEGNSLRREAEAHLANMVAAGQLTPEEAQKGANQAEFIGILAGLTESASPLGRWSKKMAGIPAGQTLLKKLAERFDSGGIKSVTQWLRGNGRRLLVDVASEAGEEAFQELGQNYMENRAARGEFFGNVAFDPNRDLGEGLGEAAGSAGIVGGIVSALLGGFGSTNNQRQKRIAEAVKRGAETGTKTAKDQSRVDADNEAIKQGLAKIDADKAAQPAPIGPTKTDESGKVVQKWTFKDAGGKEVSVEGTGLKDAKDKLPEGFKPDLKQTPTRETLTAPEGASTPETLEGDKLNRNWTAFSAESQTLGIPRAEMPQVKAEHRGALTQFLKAREIMSEDTEVLPTELKPTQAEYSQGKVDKAREFKGGDRAILVSSDNYVVDGHHQWIAKLSDHPNDYMRVIKLDAPIREVLDAVKEFPSAKVSNGATAPTTSQPAEPAPGPTGIMQKPQAQAEPAGSQSAPGPAIARGTNTPAKFVKVAAEAGKVAADSKTAKFLTDFSRRIHKAASKAFGEMEVHTLSQAEWDAHKGLGAKTPDSVAAYDPDTNSLYLNKEKLYEKNLASAIVHEAGHFAEKFYLGEEFTQREWEKLTPTQREAAIQEYEPRPNRPIAEQKYDKNDKRARSEWVAMQFARVVRGDTDQMPKTMRARLEAWLKEVRALVNKWIGDGKLTTKELDAKILEILGYAEEAAPVGAESATTPRQGKVGDMLESGEVVLTSGGRKTTPFPNIATDTERKATATVRRVDAWLMNNAIAEATARGDDFNRIQFSLPRNGGLSQADKDGMEEYLFGEQPPVPRPFLKPLAPQPRPQVEVVAPPVAPAPAPDPAPLAKLKDNVTGAIERGEKEPVVEKPAPISREAARRAKAKDAFDGLLGTPADSGQQGVPTDRIAKFVDLAQSYISDGIATPEAMAAELDATFDKKARKYSQALWNAFGMVNPALSSQPDWNAIYGGIDNPAQKAESPAREQEPDAPAVTAAPEGSADPGVVGGQQQQSRERVEGGREPENAPDRGSGSGEQRPDAGAGRRDDAPERSGNLRDLRGTKSESGVTSAGNYVITPEDQIGSGGLKTKYRDNIAAIKLLKQITAENRPATVGEQRILVRYVGWGGMKSAFNPNSKDWAKEFKEVKELLTDEEYKAARRSVLDAHYTSETVITRGIYAAMQRFGFTGGKMVEGGVGAGHFIGLMPASMRGPSSYLGVEKDPTTARIAQLLYPEARILNQGFEDSNLAPGTFDASVGNPPFGDTKLYDKRFKEASKHSIHNFFILKQLELLRPGGVAGFVVSRYFLDTQSTIAREAIAAKAEFLGAIRLPNTAFKQNANTEVTTDIVFFRRVPDGQTTKQDWVEAVQVKDEATGKPYTINGWLNARPEMMLGKMALTGSMYSDAEPTLEPRANQDLGADLTAAVAQLPQAIYQSVDRATAKRLSEPNPTPAGSVPSEAKVGSYFVDEKGNLHVRLPDVNEERRSAPVTDMKEGTAERVKAILPVRTALNRLVKAEFDAQSTDKTLAAFRAALNKTYDAFVAKYGYLNQAANRRAFYSDPESARLLGLEANFDSGVSAMVAKKQGTAAREPSAQKAAIFTRRVNAPYTEVTAVETSKEALAVSLNQRGEVDLEYMAQLSGKSTDTLVDDLAGLIFETPRGGFQSKEQYLSGNVRQKLAEARVVLNQTQDAKWQKNVDALNAVIPADIAAADISVPVGAPWVPASDVAQFAREITARAPDTVLYRKHDGGWLFRHNDNSVAATQTYGTSRADFGEIFANLLNSRPTLIYDKDSDDKQILNQQETALAGAKAEEIKAKWEEWVWQDQDRRERLARFYNDNFNNYVDPNYDGSHLTLPGSNPEIQLRQHQKNVVWRTITDRRALYDHVVGAGKTFAGVASFMEMKRMGRVRKPLFVVPNHLTGQWRDDFLKLYPSANVLATQPNDFDKDSRGTLFAKILTGEYDAVIIGHSQFKKIGVSPEIEKQLLNEMVAEIAESIEAMKKAEGGRGRSSRPVAQAEKTKERLEERLKKLAEVGSRDTAATFEELGIDGLFVDEAHEFKNLFYTTQMQRVAGLGNAAGSQKAFDLYLKTRYMRQRFAGKAPVVFATGTPISNSLVEMFTMQRYLQGEVLEGMGLKSLDAWAKVFGEVAHVYEVDPTGTGYRMATRLAQFQNVGELSALYRTVADVITMADLEQQAQARGERFPVPKVKGGKPTNYVADRTKEQTEYFGVERQAVDEAGNPKFDSEGNPIVSYPEGTILYRVDNMPTDPRKDNMLKLTNDARKAGLDMRLIDPAMPDRPESKINKAVSEIVDVYEKWSDDKGTQLVFCDLSVPASARGKATKKAKEEADEFYFREIAVAGGGMKLEPIGNAKPVEVEGFDAFKFFSYKNDRGNWLVVERTTGKSVGVAESTMKGAVEAAALRLANVKNFAEIIRTQAQPDELVAQARGEWAAAQDTAKAESEAEQPEGEQGISVDELLADQSKFSVYDDMKAKLIAAGIPENEIAFIHDYDTPDKKAKLFKAMNAGTIRVLFGSTPKLGAGTNVQERLVALHHLDAPWRPSDLEQREGRIVRQGNKLYARDPDGFEVTVNRYATKQTYDTRMWQILEHKARGIEGFRKADRSTRRIADVSGEAANSSDMKAAASGDPLIQREIELRNERQKLELLQKAWTRNRHELQGRAKWLQDAESRHKSAVDLANERIAARQTAPDPFTFTKADGTVHEGKEGVAPLVAEAVKKALSSENAKGDADLGKYRGFEFSVQRGGSKFVHFEAGRAAGKVVTGFSIFARPASGKGNWSEMTSYTSDDTISDVGFVQRMDNWLDAFDNKIDIADRVLANEKKQLADVEAELTKPFAQESRLVAVREEHEKTRGELLNKRKKASPPPDAPLGTPAEPELDDSVRQTITFEDAPAEYANRPDIQDRINSIPDLRGARIKSPAAIPADTQGVSGSGWATAGMSANTAGGPAPQVSTLERAFGKRILFFEKEGVTWSAAVHPQYPNTILVNTRAVAPLTQLFGHELTHALARQDAGLYGRMRRAVLKFSAMPREYAEEKKAQGYDTDAKIQAEWIGDVVGERMGDPAFWRGILREVDGGAAPTRGTEAKSLARAILDHLKKLSDRAKRFLWGTHPFITEADRLHGIIERVMTAAAERSPGYSELPSTEDASLSTLGTPAVKGTAKQEEVLAKVTGTLEDKRTFTEKVGDYLAELGDYIQRELQQKLLDRFTAIKRLERATIGTNELDASISAYKWSRLTGNLPGVMDYLTKHGQVEYRNGSIVMKPGTKGLVDVLRPVVESGKLRLWEGYIAAFRANRLLSEGREKNFGKQYDESTGEWSWDHDRAQAEINALLELAKDNPEFEQVRQDYVEFQKSVLDLATEAGLIDPAKRELWERSDYVPFYRIVDALDGKADSRGPSKRRGFSGQTAGIRQLKGGPQQVAILENIFRNIEQMVDASFKNIAMQRIADLADENTDLMVKIPYKAVPFKTSAEETVKQLAAAGVDVGALSEDELNEVVTFWRMRAPEGKDVVSYMNQGKPVYYRVKDKPLLRSILAMGPREHSTWMKMLMAPKHALTSLVTLDPAFMAANTIRDSFSAWVIADTPIKPGWDAMRGFAKSLAKDDVMLGVMAQGGGTGHYNNMRESEVRKSFLRMTREQRDGFLNSVIDSPGKLARLYKEIGRATENANRIAIAESVLKRGGSQAEAAFQALDIMDFGLRGDSKALTFFLDTVPFMNARIQGLYRLGRGLMNDPKRVATHGAIILGATLALLASNWDDDRYWELPEWDRDLYYHLWMGGRHIRIPKPFEVGQIFSTIPERFMQFMAKDGDSKIFARRMLSMIADTFALNPIPQAIKPVAERAMNKNMLTGGRVISRSDEYKPPEQQFNPFTSALSREMAASMPAKAPEWLRSPKTLDFLIRGYFGSLGMYSVDAADAIIRPAAGYPEKPASKIGDYWLVRRFSPESDLRENKYVSEFYELHNDIEQIATRIKTLRDRGDTEEANKVLVENRDLLSYAPVTKAAYKGLNSYRRRESDIYANPRGASPEARRDELERLKKEKNRLAREAVTRAPRRPQPIYNPFK